MSLIQGQATMVQTQAILAQNQAVFMEQQIRIFEELKQIKATLAILVSAVNALPEVVREKIGFKPKEEA